MHFKLLSVLFIFTFVSCNSSDMETVVLGINGNKIEVEVAVTDEDRALGLMHREKMDENKGMIFVFEKERQVSFWMKNTLLPLSIAYIGKNGKILEIYDMKPLSLESVPSRRSSILYALEVNQGYFTRNNIAPGDMVDLSELKSYLNSSK